MATEQVTLPVGATHSLPEKLTVVQRIDLAIRALETELDNLNEAFHKAEVKYNAKCDALRYQSETLRRAQIEIEDLTKRS